MQNQPSTARGQQFDFVAPFAGKCGQALQFILIGSLVFNLLLTILGPIAEITSKAYYIIMILLSSGLSIYGFFQLYSSANSVCLKRTAILFILAEALFALGVITADMGISAIMRPERMITNSVLMCVSFVLFIMAPAVLLGDERVTSSDIKKSWPVWIGAFRLIVVSILGFLFFSLDNPKLVVALLGIINFAITYFMWTTILAPEQSILNQKK